MSTIGPVIARHSVLIYVALVFAISWGGGFLILGPERGLALSDSLRRQGTPNEVLFLVVEGNSLDAVASPGMSRLVLQADPRTVRGLTSPLTPTPIR
mgnify:CR=1 FL=1